MTEQKIIWPWDLKSWPDIKTRLQSESKGVPEIDSLAALLSGGKIKPRAVADQFNNLAGDSTALSKEDIETVSMTLKQLIMDAPRAFRGFSSRVLTAGQNSNIVLSRQQVAAIIACMFFGMFRHSVSKGPVPSSEFNDPTLKNIFSNQSVFPLRCILGYFHRIGGLLGSTAMKHKIVIKRTAAAAPIWIEKTICSVSAVDCVDELPNLHCAFSDQYIGSNMYEGAITQGEVILLSRPECLAAVLLCSRMYDNEVVTVIGAEKISLYKGYGSSVKYAGAFEDKTPFSASGEIRQCATVFMDAAEATSGHAQFISDFGRDLNKAYIAFSATPSKIVSCGNWTRGILGNHPELKFLQQLLACSLAGKIMYYTPYGNDFEAAMGVFVEWIETRGFTTMDLLTIYHDMLKQSGKGARYGDINLFETIMDS